MFLALFPILLLFGGALVRADEECQNVIRVNDLMAAGDQPSQAFLHFRNVQLLTFDAKKRPACDGEGKPAIHLPGWLRLLSGEVFIRQLPPLHNESHPLLLALTLEQDSFWVGRICEKGRTQSSFLSDEFCTLPFCQLLPAACQALASAQQGQTLPLATFFPEDNWVPLEPVFHQMLEGSWKAEAELLAGEELLLSEEETPQKLLGRVGVAGWHFVKAGDDEHEEL